MSVTPKLRPIVRRFDLKHAKNAAAHVRAGGHAFVWDGTKKCTFVFQEPAEDNPDDFGLWGIYDMGKWKWQLEGAGPLKGLATSAVPRDCFWIARRRAERDSIHPGPTREIAIDCTKCAACCQDNEVLLQPEDIKRLKDGGRPELAKPPYAKRSTDKKTGETKIVLTLLPDKRCRHLQSSNMCGIYELRPHSCSEFPMGSECCLFAREDILKLHDGLEPSAENS
ncbi:MAG: YkgJ family cysteine cluster protein [Labilithrix sp.]